MLHSLGRLVITIKDLILAIAKNKYPEHRLPYQDNAKDVMGYSVYCSLYRSVKLRSVALVVVVTYKGQIILDLTNATSTIIPLEEVYTRNIFGEVHDEIRTLIIKRMIFIDQLSKATNLPSVLNCSFTSELQIVYISRNGEVKSVTPLNGVLTLDLNDDELQVLRDKFRNTGIEVEGLTKQVNPDIKEDILYVE